MWKLAASLICASASPLLAEAFSLSLPIDCTLGESCFIQQYMDRDPGPGAKDFTCGTLSYDGHKGTDFRLPSFAEMRLGVGVLAAAPGVVTALRDGMPDTGAEATPTEALQGKDCGNGIVIRHDGGYETQYCHLKRGSIIVEKGQKVAAGEVLGEVGFSGRSAFPHLHLSLRKNGKPVDPFDSTPSASCGNKEAVQLWQPAIAYSPAGFLSAGFDSKIPDYAHVKSGEAGVTGLTSKAPAIVLWAYAYGAQAGDQMQLRIQGPEGPFFETTVDIATTQAQLMRAAGRKLRNAAEPGTYTGHIELTRGGKMIDRITTQIKVSD